MPSNKQKDKLKAAALIERTGKNEIIYDAISLVTTLENNKVIYKIMLIRFTTDKNIVSMEVLDTALDPANALGKFQIQTSDVCMDLKQMRKIAKELNQSVEKLKEENEKKATA